MLISTRLSAGVCLAAVVFLTACSSTKTPTVAVETEMAVRTATTIPEPSPEVTQRSGEATAYPGPSDEPAQGGSTETAYPGPATQPVQRNSAGTAYPAPGSYPGPAQGNTVQSPQQSAYPVPESSGQNQATTTPSPYPGPESGIQQPTAAVNTPYPGLETDTPTTSQPEASTPNRSSLTPTPLITTPSATMPPTISLTATPTGTPVTPTPTPTAIEVDPNFHPTDPATVQLASGKVQLVEFFTYWCGECRAMAPLVHSLEAQYQDRMNFVYLDTDNPATLELRKALGYRDQPDNPQFFLLDPSGKVLKKWVGAVSAEEFRDSFEAALSK